MACSAQRSSRGRGCSPEEGNQDNRLQFPPADSGRVQGPALPRADALEAGHMMGVGSCYLPGRWLGWESRMSFFIHSTNTHPGGQTLVLASTQVWG